MYYGSVYIGVVNSATYMPYSSIISKSATFPSSTIKAVSTITVSIAYATIKTYMRPPIASVPIISVICKTPIAGSPKEAYFRSNYPYPRYPIIPIRGVSPVAR